MRASLMEDEDDEANWEDLFNFIVTNCQKPLFYKSECPFYELQETSRTYRGPMVDSLKDLKRCIKKVKFFQEGNACLMTYFLAAALNKNNFKVGVITDQLYSEVQAIYDFNQELIKQTPARWEAIAYINEMQHHLEDKIDPYISYDPKIWGTSYFINEDKGNTRCNFFATHV
jgi:hypothetical protein